MRNFQILGKLSINLEDVNAVVFNKERAWITLFWRDPSKEILEIPGNEDDFKRLQEAFAK